MKAQSNKKSFTGETASLIDLCHAVSDCPHYTPNWTSEGGLVIRNFNIKNGRLDLTEKFYTDDETFKDRIRRHKPESGDLIISREAPMGEVCIIPENIECCLGQRTVLIKPNFEKVNNQFLLYSIISDFVQHQIKKSDGSGSIVSNLCIPDLEQLQIPIVELEAQNKVANVLSSLDKKIELNNCINTELEEIAKSIFNYWFVQFDFPNEEGKPYKASGGAMEWDEKLKRDIPKGWNVGNLASSEITSVIDTGVENYQGDKIYLSTSEIEGTEIINHSIVESFSSKPSRANMQPCYNSIWFARMKDTKKVLLLSDYCSEIVNNYILSTGFAGLKTPKEALYYLWNFINDNHFEEIKNKYATGTTQKSIINENLGRIYLLIPNPILLNKFHRKVESAYKKIYFNQRENIELITLRDSLLPLLMNGQVKVK